MRIKPLHIVLIYNACTLGAPARDDDTSNTDELRCMIRSMARVLRGLKHRVTILPLAQDLRAFQRRLRCLRPDVVFNQYDDIIHGALYEMRVAALVRMLGYPMTGSPALALGLTRSKYMASSLLHGVGVLIPPKTELLERISDVDRHTWQFPLIVQPSQEHAAIGVERDSVVYSNKMLRKKVRHILKTYHQPVLAQRFLPGREFNVGVLGGRKPCVLPLAEVNYSKLPPNIPPIMSYAAKWLENSVEYNKTSVICPALVTPGLAREIGRAALRSFRAVSGWGYGRVDIRLDAAGKPRVLEVNCNPSLEEDVALARSAAAAGIQYPQLLQIIINAALEHTPFDIEVPML